MSLEHSAIVRRAVGASTSARNVFASALIALFAFGSSGVTLAAQVVSEAGVPVAAMPASTLPELAPARFQAILTVMVELADQPAALVYADSLKRVVGQAGGSFASMSTAAQDAAKIAAAGQRQGRRWRGSKPRNRRSCPGSTRWPPAARIIFRTKSAYNGVSDARARAANSRRCRSSPASRPCTSRRRSSTTGGVGHRFPRARARRGPRPPPARPTAFTARASRSRSSTPASTTSTPISADPARRPPTPASRTPVRCPTRISRRSRSRAATTSRATPTTPQPRHRTRPRPRCQPDGLPTATAPARASLVGGLGVTTDGGTFVGVYDNATDIAALRDQPGLRAEGLLYPLRVFGATGSTNLVIQAIDWAVDPNGDGNVADHMDVISMSLGANNGYPDDPDAIAASNAAAAGVIVASAAGNAGDSYYIVSSPSVGQRHAERRRHLQRHRRLFLRCERDREFAAGALPAQKYHGASTAAPARSVPPEAAWPATSCMPNPAGSLSAAADQRRGDAGQDLHDRPRRRFVRREGCRLRRRPARSRRVIVQSAAEAAHRIRSPWRWTVNSIPAMMIVSDRRRHDQGAARSDDATGQRDLNNDNGFVSLPSTAADTMRHLQRTRPAARRQHAEAGHLGAGRSRSASPPR